MQDTEISFKKNVEESITKLPLTFVLWVLLPAPDYSHIFSVGNKVLVLPLIAPLSLLYGLSSVLYQISRRVMWGYFPGGGLDLQFYLTTFSIGLGYLLAAYLLARILEEPLSEFLKEKQILS